MILRAIMKGCFCLISPVAQLIASFVVIGHLTTNFIRIKTKFKKKRNLSTTFCKTKFVDTIEINWRISCFFSIFYKISSNWFFLLRQHQMCNESCSLISTYDWSASRTWPTDFVCSIMICESFPLKFSWINNGKTNHKESVVLVLDGAFGGGCDLKLKTIIQSPTRSQFNCYSLQVVVLLGTTCFPLIEDKEERQ